MKKDRRRSAPLREMILLMAPPAGGKTSLILDVARSLEGCGRVIFISPLKALSLELAGRFEASGIETFCVDSRRGLSSRIESVGLPQMTILSYEHVTKPLIDFLKQKLQNVLLVFDEFHLLFYWGSSFRPALWESFYELAETAHPILSLSATIDKKIVEEMKNSFLASFDRIWLIDRGNFFLRHPPRAISLVSRQWEIWIHLEKALGRGKRCLVFLPYRREVEVWRNSLAASGRCVLSCVGGQTLEFRERLKTCEKVDAILATHALGHGVNLPPLDHIYLAYPVEEKALWLQMVGRGGRDGRPYKLYCMNVHGLPLWQKLAAKVRNAWGLLFSWSFGMR
ncbi:MAG: helicase-related protein [Bacteriovoracales bacterium]|nr:helicase-related protein [Bacteriovoracales bacterium]